LADEPAQSKRVAKDPTVYAIGNIVRRLVGFLMLPIYTRYLTPADYGVVGLLTLAIAIMEPLFGARLVEVVPKYYFECGEGKRRNSVIFTALVVTGSVSAITAVLSYLLRDYSSQVLFGSRDYAVAVGLFGVQILTQPIEYYGLTYLRIIRRPWTFLAVSLSKLILQLTLNIVLVVWLNLGVMGVVISSVCSSSIYAAGLCISTIAKVGMGFDGALAKAMIRFSWPLWLSSLSGLYIYQGGVYFLRIFGSLGQVGLYELAARVAAVLTFVVWVPFNQYWEAVRFKYYRDPASWGVYSETFKLLTGVLMVAALCLTVGAEPVIRMMAAPAFHKAYLAVPILVMAIFLASLTGFVRFGLLVGERAHSVPVIGYLTAAVVTVLNICLIPSFGMVGAAAALVGARIAQFAITFILSRRNFDMRIELKPVMGLLGILFFAALAADLLPPADNLLADCLERAAVLLLTLAPVAVTLWRTPVARAQLGRLIWRGQS